MYNYIVNILTKLDYWIKDFHAKRHIRAAVDILLDRCPYADSHEVFALCPKCSARGNCGKIFANGRIKYREEMKRYEDV